MRLFGFVRLVSKTPKIPKIDLLEKVFNSTNSRHCSVQTSSGGKSWRKIGKSGTKSTPNLVVIDNFLRERHVASE